LNSEINHYLKQEYQIQFPKIGDFFVDKSIINQLNYQYFSQIKLLIIIDLLNIQKSFIMKTQLLRTTILIFTLLATCPTFINAQEESKTEKKVVVITKTIDENGNVTVKKKVIEGGDINEVEIKKMMEEVEKEMEVQVEIKSKNLKEHKTKESKSKKKYKTYTIEIDEDDDDEGEEEHKVMIFKSDDGAEKVIITKDGEQIDLKGDNVKIIKMKGDEGEDIEIKIKELMEDEDNVFIHETKEHNGFLGIVANPGKEGSLTLLDVVEGSPAEKAGLQKDDVINSINGQKLTNFNELIEVLDDLKPNDKVEIGYNRGEETKVTKATLAEHSNQTIEKIIEIETDEIHDHRGGNGDKMIWIEKGDEEMKFGDDADEIIIEETIEESEENGKKIIKKKKVITRIKKE
jgi:hypothetical protein